MDSLNNKIEALIKEKLSEPLYLRIDQTFDGRLRIEQIQFLRCDELARLTGVETRTVRNWVAKGVIPHYRPPGSSVVLFSLAEVIECIRKNAQAA